MHWSFILCLLLQTPQPLTTPKPDYPTTIAAVASQRTALADRLKATPAQRDALLNEAETLLTKVVARDLAPHWYGTDWAFHGTTQTPRQGAVACGYFVTTLLRDAGLDLPRVRMAQTTSEKMIRSLVNDAYVWRFSNVPIETFTAAVKSRGLGLYVVGLDRHTGFIVCQADGVWFVHSSYRDPWQVVCEPADQAAILAASRYRVLGKLSDPELLERWLLGLNVPLR